MKPIYSLTILCALGCFAAAPAWGVTPASDSEVVMALLQKSWDGIKTYRARFKQEVFSKQLGGEPDVSEGTLTLSKPSRLRWESETESTTSILNDKELIILSKALRRGNRTVTIHKKGKTSFIPRSLSFLTGRDKFSDLYHFELIEQTDKFAKLKLTPKDSAAKAQGESYIAEINKDGYLLHALTTETVDSRVVTSFTKVEINPKLGSDLFKYKPEPTDILRRN